MVPAGPGSRRVALFLVMSLIWGATWIAIKTGVEAVPPLMFAATRLLAAGTILLAFVRPGDVRTLLGQHPSRLVLVALLINTFTYGLIFWGVQFVTSGLSAVVNLALMPIALFSIGLAAGEERYAHRNVLGVVSGIAGLVILFWPRLASSEASLLGLAAIVTGTLAYCLGSVLSRPLLRQARPLALASLQMLIGGAALAIVSLLVEPEPLRKLTALTEPSVLAGWLFLVLGGAVVGHTIYLSLIRDWGPSRAGLYAFVSPLIAVALGIVVFAEPFGPFEIIGSMTMLSAAALARGGTKTTRDGSGAVRAATLTRASMRHPDRR